MAKSYIRDPASSGLNLGSESDNDSRDSLSDIEDHPYQFDIRDGELQQAYTVQDGLVKPTLLKGDESWAVDGDNVIKTETEYGVVATTVYSDPDGDGLYERTSSTLQDSSARELADSLEQTPLFLAMHTGSPEYILPERFSGPSSLNLKYQMINSSENAVLLGSDDNDFIKVDHASSKGKAVDGSGGDDVIDGGVGSAFITGGAGSNTFFLDGRTVDNAWSTVTDFKLGTDKATVWGFKAGVSSVAAIEENVGASGYEGLTLNFQDLVVDESTGKLDDGWKSLTLADKTLADFGVDSLEALNAQIEASVQSHFSVGQITDEFGAHDYLYIA